MESNTETGEKHQIFKIGSPDAMKTNTHTQEEGTPLSIEFFVPIEVIENILSRLSVKSLIRFQSVCKLWHTIISDPRFCRIHYHTTHKNNLYLVRPFDNFDFDHLVKVENKKLGTERVLNAPFEPAVPKRTCNGIVLMVKKSNRVFGLWNPSTRKHYNWIEHHPGHTDYVRNYGLYYDPIIDDYRIAMFSDKYYTIYSCKSTSWGETKPFPSIIPTKLRPQDGVNVNGSSSFYWLSSEEIVCFDVRDEKLSKLPLPTEANLDTYYFHLTSMSGRLCLYRNKRSNFTMYILWVMERHNHSWRELINIEKETPQLRFFLPQFLTNEDNVVLRLKTTTPGFPKFIVYDHFEKNLMEFNNYIDKAIRYMLPYSESLYFPIPNIFLKRRQETEAKTRSKFQINKSQGMTI